MKKLLLFVAIATITLTVKAQNENSYKNAIGVRLGSQIPAVTSGVTYKRFLNNSKAIEGILSFGDGFTICGLYQIHKPISAVENLQWFYGAGAYAGINNNFRDFGIAGIVGLNYKFVNIPLNITLDWKPELNLIEYVGFEASGLGISARFTF